MFGRIALTTASRLSMRQAAGTSAVSKAALLRPTVTVGKVAKRWISSEERKTIQSAVEGSPVVLFMKGTPSAPECGFSRAVIQILELQGVPPAQFKSYNVLSDSSLRSSIKEYSEWPTIPQLYVKGEFVGGCDIVLSMHQSGELEKLLEDKGVLEKIEEPTGAKSEA